MVDTKQPPSNMNRRKAIGSVASIGVAGALSTFGMRATSQTSPPIPQREQFNDYVFDGAVNSWHDIPYGTEEWTENAVKKPNGQPKTLRQDIDLTLPGPGVTMPAAGWPVVVYFHATGDTKRVSFGGTLDINIRTPALEAGFAFIAVEFRHPRTNVNLAPPLPHFDTGLALQFIRSLHVAFDLDRSNVFALCRSRGNLALWQSLQPDMALSTATTYAGQQSSLLKAIWSMSGQATYRNERWAQLFIHPDDRAAWLAAPCNYSHPECGSAIDDVATASPSQVPDIVMQHELPYYNQLMHTCVFNPTPKNEPAVNDEHYPDNGRVMRDTYVTNGYADRILTLDNVEDTNNPDQLLDCVPWFEAVMGGARAVEAWAIVRAKRRGCGLYYARTPNDSKLGVWKNALGGTPTTINGLIGSVVDGSYGLGDRNKFSPLVGYPARQNIDLYKPALAQFANGNFGIRFEGNDRLVVEMSSPAATQSCYYWTNLTEQTTPGSTSTTALTIGHSGLANQIMSVCVAHPSQNAITERDRKGFRQFANLIASTNFVQPVVLPPGCSVPPPLACPV